MGWGLSSAFLLYMIMHGANFYRLPASELMGIDTSIRSAIISSGYVSIWRKKLPPNGCWWKRMKMGCMKLSQSKAATLRLAQEGYSKLSQEYPFLWGGVWRGKPVLLSHWWSYTGITGMYFPFLAEANVNIDIPDWDIPSTAAHELGPYPGFAGRECNFSAFLTSIASDSADCRYSGYLSAYIYCSNALYAYNGEMGAEARSHCSEGVRRIWRLTAVTGNSSRGRIRKFPPRSIIPLRRPGGCGRRVELRPGGAAHCGILRSEGMDRRELTSRGEAGGSGRGVSKLPDTGERVEESCTRADIQTAEQLGGGKESGARLWIGPSIPAPSIEGCARWRKRSVAGHKR